MALTDGLLGSAQPTNNITGFSLLDSIYSENAVILENATSIFSGKESVLPEVGLPLIGFRYKPEGNLELLKYRWSQYPYLNKANLTFAAVKDTTDFSVSVISPITGDTPVAASIGMRAGLVTLLDKYCSRGGMFTVITLWGTKRHCVLTDLSGIAEGDTMDGVLFKMSFNQPNFDMTGADESMSDFMKRATNGGAVNK